MCLKCSLSFSLAFCRNSNSQTSWNLFVGKWKIWTICSKRLEYDFNMCSNSHFSNRFNIVLPILCVEFKWKYIISAGFSRKVNQLFCHHFHNSSKSFDDLNYWKSIFHKFVINFHFLNRQCTVELEGSIWIFVFDRFAVRMVELCSMRGRLFIVAFCRMLHLIQQPGDGCQRAFWRFEEKWYCICIIGRTTEEAQRHSSISWRRQRVRR